MTKNSKSEPAEAIAFLPIGIIHSPYRIPADVPKPIEQKELAEGMIEIKPEFCQGLQDLAGFSHIIVIFVFHHSLSSDRLLVTPPRQQQQRGVFATRSPHRPNPIGVSILRLKAINNNRLSVADLDMIKGTPVLDIKPFIPAEIDANTLKLGWLNESNRQT
jgi:tRNA-Thr(GGU) m(6)t(6)A37 methyltransferase TsaA